MGPCLLPTTSLTICCTGQKVPCDTTGVTTIPFDSNGNYNLPIGYLAVTGQNILASQHNPPLQDIAAALSQVLLRSGVAPMLGPLNMNGSSIVNLRDASDPQEAATYGQLSASMPVGSILDFAGQNAPSGFLLCAGQAVSREEFATLFAVIGTNFGVGNGTTTFNVPDFRGRVAAGKDDMGGSDAGRLSFFGSLAKIIGGNFGSGAHVLTPGQMPIHSHGVNDPGHEHDQDGESGFSTGASSGQVRGVFPLNKKTSQATTGISIQNSGNSEAHTNAQPTLIVNKIIRAR